MLFFVLIGFNPISGFAIDVAPDSSSLSAHSDANSPVSGMTDPASLEAGMALYMAARRGQSEVVGLLIARGVDINFREPQNGLTALHAAVAYSGWQPADANGRMPKMDSESVRAKQRLAEMLIAKGADVNAKSRGGITPLHEAGSEELAELLIAHGAGVNAEAGDGNTPLFTAAWQDKERVQVLLSHGANVNHKMLDGRTPLDVAVNAKRGEIVALLIASGAGVNVKDRDGATLLERVIAQGSSGRLSRDGSALAKLLLAGGAKLNEKPNLGLTELHWAISAGDPSLVEALLRMGASLDAKDRDGGTPMAVAIEADNLQMVELLIAHGSDVNARDKSGTPLLHRLIQQRRYPLAEAFLRNKADVHSRGENAKSALFEAVELDAAAAALAGFPAARAISADGVPKSTLRATAVQFIDLLIAYGADAKAKNDIGETPLHLAFTAKVARRLIRAEVPVNVPRKDGATALHRAVSLERPELVSTLLANRANVNAKDAEGETPLHQAKNEKIARTLLSRGALVDVPRVDGATPLHLAAVYGRYEVAMVLIAKGANVNAKSESGIVPLHYARGLETVKLLLDSGASVALTDDEGNTPLHVVDLPDVAMALIGHGAKSDARNGQGETPLLQTVRIYISNLPAHGLLSGPLGEPLAGWHGGNPGVLKVLLDKGADVNAADNAGNTSLSYITQALGRQDLAEVAGDLGQIQALLLAHGAKPAAKVGNLEPANSR